MNAGETAVNGSNSQTGQHDFADANVPSVDFAMSASNSSSNRVKIYKTREFSDQNLEWFRHNNSLKLNRFSAIRDSSSFAKLEVADQTTSHKHNRGFSFVRRCLLIFVVCFFTLLVIAVAVTLILTLVVNKQSN